jgi:tetratricopeptide (TPR) repeat protein
VTGCTEVLPDEGALARLEREITELRRLVEDGRDELLPVLADQLLEQARLLDEAGDPDAAFEALDTALDWVDERPDDGSLLAAARVWTARADRDHLAGHVRESVQKLQQAATCYAAVAAPSLADRQAHANVLNRIGYRQYSFGEYAASRATLDDGLAIYDRHPELDPDGRMWLSLNRANTAYALADTAFARELYNRVIERATGVPEHALSLCAAHMGLGNTAAQLGDRPAAIAAYECSTAVFDDPANRRGPWAMNLSKALGNLAGEYHRIGRLTDALAAQSRAVEAMAELVESDANIEHIGQLADTRAQRARILADLGHFEAALDEALEVIATLEDAHAATGNAHLEHMLGLIKKDLGAWERRRTGASFDTCSFCGKPRAGVRRLISGSRAVICDGCWETALDQRDAGARSAGERCEVCNEADRGWFYTAREHVVCGDCLDRCTTTLREDGVRRRAEAAEYNKQTESFCCSFCGRKRAEVRKLISGPKVFICDNCACLCVDILAKDKAQAPKEKICSFCANAGRAVLITGPNDVLICDECVGLCRDIIDEEIEKETRTLDLPPAPKPRDDLFCSFCAKPRREVKKLVTGEGAVICDECLGLCCDILEKERKSAPSKRTLACSFCGTHEARSLITGLGKQICDACVDRSLDAIARS